VLTPWRDEVAGLLEAWYPGQQGGTAITHVLFGDVDPGGRLPVTFPRQASDTPTSGDLQAYPGVPETVVYREGVLVGYRWYDAKQIAPAFPFGFGLSYTSFRYDDFRVQGTAGTPGASVTVRITNTGARRGTAVPEVYAGIARPDASTVEPPWQLVGYDSVSLAPGQSAAIHIDVDARHLAYWDTGRAGWRVAPGCDRLAIGTSSRAILDSATVTVGNASCPGSSTSTPAQ
jgi:beta-glucosidase